MKEIKFVPKSEEAEILVPKPRPTREYIPEWYKKLPMHHGEKLIYCDSKTGAPNLTAKMCTPFSDSFNMGYIQETWCDIFIEKMDDGSIHYSYSMIPEIMSHRDINNTVKFWSSDYHNSEFLWKIQWVPQLPDGYSVIYTHPFNMPELPFFSFTGIVDADTYRYETEGNHPFLLKNNFFGMIPAGTPFLQIIPFKRDPWKAKYEEYNKKNQIKSFLPRKKFVGGYKKMFWQKKIFR